MRGQIYRMGILVIVNKTIKETKIKININKKNNNSFPIFIFQKVRKTTLSSFNFLFFIFGLC
jgi:hypothetical protein